IIAVNGSQVTVQVNNSQAFSYTFAPRILNGEPVGLNKGFIGVGSDNSRGIFDNLVIQVLPPRITLDTTEDFDDGLAQAFVGDQTGVWTTTGGRYSSTAAAGTTNFDTVNLGASFLSTSYAEVQSIISTNGIGGIIFDQYDVDDYKFVALDVPGQKVLIGHVDPRRGWVVENSVNRSLVAGTDYALQLIFNGTAVSVVLGGGLVTTHGFNSAIVDGALGVLARGGATSFDSFRVLTNDPAFTMPSVYVSDALIVEGAAGANLSAAVTLSLSNPALTATSVNWTTVGGTATAGVDFVTSSGTVTFAPGSTTASILIPILGDGLFEPNEAFTVLLSNPVGLIMGQDTGIVTINDDDAPPSVAVTSADAQGAEQGTDPLTFTITRTNNTSTQVVVNLAWSGTASLGSDYTVTATGGTLSANGLQLTLASGATTATLTVTPVNDTAVELTESVTLALSAGTGYTVGTPSAQSANILDNDLPTVSVADTSVTEGNNGTKTVAVTVTLSAPKSTPVTVSYATVAGTATAGSDYQTASGTVTFAAGVTSQTINVTINGDRTREPNETFQVVLSNPNGGTIGTGTATVTILDDERALLAAEPAAGSTLPVELTVSQLEGAVTEAKAYWLSVDPTADFGDVTFSIFEMDGLILGLAAENEITLDATAAGYGWFVDDNPLSSASIAAAARMDLLSVLRHELGHVLGFEHDDAPKYAVMDEELEAGLRLSFNETIASAVQEKQGRSQELHFAGWLWDDGQERLRWNTTTGDFEESAGESNRYRPFQTAKPRKAKRR
ncbi:MAG TPA: Calx-beta domain-containing protein, partial [Terriglobia bacterium]|nr:Calx-beta domain-containing protein [Terriglobia bacterium]